MRVPATCHSTVRPWGQCSQSTQGWLTRAGGRVASLGLWPGRKESCKSLLLLSTSRQGLLLSQGAISTSPPGKEKEDLSSLSVFLLPCKALGVHRGVWEVPGSWKFRGKSVISWVRHCLLGAWSRAHLQRKHLWVQRKNLIFINLQVLSQAAL